MKNLRKSCSQRPRKELLLDGRFVTVKAPPGDDDATWETAGVDLNRWGSVLLDLKRPRTAMKAKSLGGLVPASANAAPGVLFRDFF